MKKRARLKCRKLSKKEVAQVKRAEEYWRRKYRPLTDPIEKSRKITGKDLSILITS